VNRSTSEILARRLLREYLEMPGLTLSLAQSARLLSADVPTCRRVLDSLIDARCLRCTAAGTYAREVSHGSLELWKSHARSRLTALQHAPNVRLYVTPRESPAVSD
jgi:hypothetical protein